MCARNEALCREKRTIKNSFIVSNYVLVLNGSHKPDFVHSVSALNSRHLAHVCLFKGIQLPVGKALSSVYSAIRALPKSLLDLQRGPNLFRRGFENACRLLETSSLHCIRAAVHLEEFVDFRGELFGGQRLLMWGAFWHLDTAGVYRRPCLMLSAGIKRQLTPPGTK